VQVFDVAIVGGGPAGLQAALLAGRACLKVVVIDGGEARNATTHAAHSFPTRDGIAPFELRRIATEQLARYDVTVLAPRSVSTATGENGAFDLTLDDGGRIDARKLILATGVRDALPDVPGLRDLWGRGVFHCPYCDGWEVRDQPIALMMKRERVPEAMRHFRTWSHDLTIVPMPEESLGDEIRVQANELVVTVRDDRVSRVVRGQDGVTIAFESGPPLDVAAMFVQPGQVPRTDLARHLGCETIDDGPFPGLLRVDGFGRTTVEGVFAAGDVATGMQQAWIASSAGGLAGVMAHRELIVEGFPFD